MQNSELSDVLKKQDKTLAINNTNKSIQSEYNISYTIAQTNPIQQSTNECIQYYNDLGYIDTKRDDSKQIIDGYFPKENLVKAMAIKKVNKTLCGLLLCLIFVSIVSYYFVVSSEIKLNEYSRHTIMLNDENADLQNQLDRLKSFSNVDLTMQKNNLLQKPDQVIEAPEVVTAQTKPVQFETERPFSWSIGY